MVKDAAPGIIGDGDILGFKQTGNEKTTRLVAIPNTTPNRRAVTADG